MEFQTVQSEKASAMARFNRLRTIATFWRFFEVLIAFFVLLWSPSAAKLAGKSVLKMCNYAYTPLFSFFVFNLIIAVVVVLSRKNREKERERERERETVPGFVVFDESDFEIPLPEDLKMVVFSEIGEKIDADVAEEARKIDFFSLSEIREKKTDFPSAKEDRKMLFFPKIEEKKNDFPVADEDQKMVFFPEIMGGKIDLPEIMAKKIDFPVVAEKGRKVVVFSENGGKIDFPVTLPPCVAAAEAAIEAARRRIRKFERSQSARLRRDMETGLPRQQLIRRSETETQMPRQQRLLRRSETERAISVIDKVDNLSSEEFRRTIEEFIAKQKKTEKQLLIK